MRFFMLPLFAVALALPLDAQTVKAAPIKETEIKATKINWDGEWTLIPDESDKLEPMIDEHVKDLNFAMKPYWKKKLQKACKPPQAMDILYSGAEFSVTFDRERPAECSPDGTASTWKRGDGEAFQVTLRKEGPRMTQSFQGDGYSLANVYSMRKDGNTLALQVTYTHPKLNAFSYKLVFKRAE